MGLREIVSKPAVTFDLDGTLADTIADLSEAVNQGRTCRDFRVFRCTISRNTVTSWATALASLSCERCPHTFEMRLDRTTPYSGVPELLFVLPKRGMARTVLPNKLNELGLKVVSGLFATGSFPIVCGKTVAVLRKPDPSSALDIGAKLGVFPVEAVYIGNPDVDIATTRGAGMTALGAA